MDEIRLIKDIRQYNQFWLDKPIRQIEGCFKREEIYQLLKELDEKEITAITGPRQVGKTTLMLQVIEELISKKVKKENIIYFSFDDATYLNQEDKIIEKILDAYSRLILKEQISETKSKLYIFFDEIQNITRWSEQLKKIYDLNYKIKFMISGSSSAEIMKGSSESLVGRMNPLIIYPLSFYEVMKLNGLRVNREKLQKIFTEFIVKEKGDIKSKIEPYFSELFNYKTKIDILLDSFVLKGGYPKLIFESNLEKCSSTLMNYFSLVVYKDLVRVFNIRNPKALEQLAMYVAKEGIHNISYNNLARLLGIKIDTLKEYINLLETVFLVSVSDFFAKSRAKKIRKEKKIYFVDMGVRNALLGLLNQYLLDDKNEIGKIIQNVVYEECRRFLYRLKQKQEVDYWKKKFEVDIVLKIFNRVVPIEVKYKHDIKEEDKEPIRIFMKKFKSSFGVVVSKEAFSYEENILMIPAWMFLLII